VSEPLVSPPQLLLPPPLRGARAAFAFLSRIPVGGFPYRSSDWRWAPAHFPLVGLAVGALSAALFALTYPLGASVAALLALAACGSARAATPEPTQVVARRTVRVVVWGSADEAEQLRAALGELFGRISVDLELSLAPSPLDPGASTVDGGTPDPAEGNVVLAEVDLRASDAAVVRLSGTGAAGGDVRSVPQRASRALLLEETALVVYTGSESLLDTSPPAAAPPAPQAKAIAPKTPPVLAAPAAPGRPMDQGIPNAAHDHAGTPWLVEGTMLVGARAFTSDDATVTGFGLGVRGRVGRGRWVPSVWLFGEFHVPFRETAEGVELSTSVWSVRFEPSFELVRAGAFRVELGAGAGADVFVLSPVTQDPGAELGTARHDASAVLASLLAASLATGRASRVVLAAMLDYDLARRRYLVQQGSETYVLLEPWRFRPALCLGFAFEAAGGGKP